MSRTVIYIHGKGGSSSEASHYIPLFPNDQVIGFGYDSETPWEAETEFQRFLEGFRGKSVILLANSIGAYFSLHAFKNQAIEKAYFISPIVNMERLILDMMTWAGVSEEELSAQGIIETDFGETLSMEYLTWVRKHPISWNVPTSILYGTNDHLQSLETVKEFARKTNSKLTVMDNGEHWFHTDEQMAFLDQWITNEK